MRPVILVVLATVVAVAASRASASVSSTASVACPPSLQALVDAAAPGTEVSVPPCLYRERVTIDKPLLLIAKPGAEIRGSDVWSDGWLRTANGWVRAVVPSFPRHGECADGTQACLGPEQVFLDGRQLRQTTGPPQPGEFSVTSGVVTLAEDPAGRTVEVTVRTHWIVGRADDVVVQGFRMSHAAVDAQNGAISTGGYSRWTVRDNVLTRAHGAAVSFDGGAGHRLIGNEIAHNGQIGVHGEAAVDVLVQGNRIHANNTAGFDGGWEAGGVKMKRMQRLVLDGNEVFENDGPGLWCDIDCVGTVISRNRVYRNRRFGIADELGRDARIFGNVVWENGWGKHDWGFGAGILCQNCAGAHVYSNTLAWNAVGISVVSQARPPWQHQTGIEVHDNVVASTEGSIALGWFQDWAGVLFDPASRNRGERNRFWFPGPESDAPRFEWVMGAVARLDELDVTMGGRDSSYLSDAEKERILAESGVPHAPGRR